MSQFVAIIRYLSIMTKIQLSKIHSKNKKHSYMSKHKLFYIFSSFLFFSIRKRMNLRPNQAIYLLVNNRSMMNLSMTIAEVYNEHKDDDGMLHVTYASQEVFGAADESNMKNWRTCYDSGEKLFF